MSKRIKSLVGWVFDHMLWLLSWGALVAYGIVLFLEKTAPVNPTTGFHTSSAGAILYLAYPVATVLQNILLLSGFVLLVVGLVGNRKWTRPGVGLLTLGLGFMAVNYLISQ